MTGHLDVVELMAAMIRNACVNDGTPDSGHEDRSVATLQDYLGSSGTVVEPHPGRQSVVYRVPGRVPGAPALMLLPHLDVVPANPKGWTRDPFAAERHDGFVWGRGALDMLNITAAMAAVFRPYLTGELPPLPGDLVLGAVADEEAGGALGAGHLVDHHWDLVACDYLLTEVAAPGFGAGVDAVLPVTVAEKGPSWRTLRATGEPGHASQPHGTRNALLPLAAAASRIAEAPLPVLITEEWRAFVTAVGLPAALTDPATLDEAVADLDAVDPAMGRWAHACTHLTVTPTVMAAGSAQNVVPDEGLLRIDARLLPGQDDATVDEHLRRVLGDGLDGVTVTTDTRFAPNASPTSGPLWEAMGDAAGTVTGSGRLAPMLIPVTTDARFFRARGVHAYGAGLFDDRMGFGELLGMFHGNDERVSEESVRLTTAFLAATVRRFGERTGA